MGKPLHPDRSRLELFVQGELPAAENRRVVRHLLSGCSRCRQATRELLPVRAGSGPSEPRTTPAGPAIDSLVQHLRASEATFQRERSLAPLRLSELRRHPVGRQLVLVLNSPVYQTLPLCDLILQQAFQMGVEDSGQAVDLAQVGVAIAGALDPDRYGRGLAGDFRGRAWTILGNARRIASDFQGAAEAFQCAEEALAEGSGDPIEKAEHLILRARLEADQSDFRTAFSFLDRAIGLHHRFRERHREGCALIEKGTCLSEAGDPERAIRFFRHGLALLEPGREPRRTLVAKHNLLLDLQACGRFREASELLEEVRALHSTLGNRLDLLRLRWLEGQIARDQGKLARAEAAFLEVRDAFVEREMAFDAAQISLDLATVYLEQGRFSEISSLAAQLVEIFGALKVHREALAALMLFQRTADAGRVTSRWIAELARYVTLARADPELRFRSTDEA